MENHVIVLDDKLLKIWTE